MAIRRVVPTIAIEGLYSFVQALRAKPCVLGLAMLFVWGGIVSSSTAGSHMDGKCKTMARPPDHSHQNNDNAALFTVAVASGDWGLVRAYLLWEYATPGNLTPRQKARVERERLSAELIPYSAKGDRRTVLRYLRLGADPNAGANADDFAFPLAWAARCDHPDVVKILLAHGAKVNARFTYPLTTGMGVDATALEWAVENDARKSVAVLLAHGANPRLMSHFEPLPGFEHFVDTSKGTRTALDAAADPEIRRMIRKVLKDRRRAVTKAN